MMEDSDESNSEDEGFFDAVESHTDIDVMHDSKKYNNEEIVIASSASVKSREARQSKKESSTNNNAHSSSLVSSTSSLYSDRSHNTNQSMRALMEEASQPGYKTCVYSTASVDPVKPPSESPTISQHNVKKLNLESLYSSNKERVHKAKGFLLSSREELLSRKDVQKKNIINEDADDDADRAEQYEAAHQKPTPPRKEKIKMFPKVAARRRPLPAPLDSERPRNAISVTNQKQRNGEQSMLLLFTATNAHKGPIWCIKFSLDHKYLATSGEDQKILIWKVAEGAGEGEGAGQGEGEGRDSDSHQPPEKQEEGFPTHPANANLSAPQGCEIQLLSPRPILVFEEHCADIIDLSWSATSSNFLLSASLDKTVRLWHTTRQSSMHIFHHADLVTSVDFHPQEDSLFVSGGFDRKLRLWSIPDGRVVDWAQTPDIITAAKFTPSGLFVVAGLIQGQVYLYSTEGMRYYTQISCKNRHGKTSQGRKVTGLSFCVNHDENTDHSTLSPIQKINSLRISEQLLVTTNDSRIRLFGLDDYCMISKYKGLVNTSMQIKAHFSDSGNSIICGSEVGNIYIWNTSTTIRNRTTTSPPQFNKTNLSYNRNNTFSYFQACNTSSTTTTPIITDALFVPIHSTQNALLGSNLFPTIKKFNNINYDFSTAMIVSSDYEGTIRVFLKKSCFDAMIYASGPEGFADG